MLKESGHGDFKQINFQNFWKTIANSFLEISKISTTNFSFSFECEVRVPRLCQGIANFLKTDRFLPLLTGIYDQLTGLKIFLIAMTNLLDMRTKDARRS